MNGCPMFKTHMNDVAKLYQLARSILILLIFTGLFSHMLGISSAENDLHKNQVSNQSAIFFSNEFERSIPDTVVVGKHYEVLLPIENQGNDKTDYSVFIFCDRRYLYFNESYNVISLNGGEKYIFKLNMIPHKQHSGKLIVKAKIYEGDREVDSISDSISQIKNEYPSNIFVVMAVLLSGVLVCMLYVSGKFSR